MHPITYEEHKDIANLAMFKYGSRCPETIVGNNYRTEIGGYVQIIVPYLQSGMNDSEIWDDERVRYRVDSGGGLVTEQSTYTNGKNSQILMGYRRLSGGYSQYLDGGVTTSLDDNEGNYWKITNAEGESRYLQVTRSWNQQVRGTHFGRFMDLADVTKATNTQNSKTQFYGRFMSRMFENIGNGNNRELLIGDDSNDRYSQTCDIGRILLPTMEWTNANARNRTTRIAYSGDIEVMQDLQQFLAVPFNF